MPEPNRSLPPQSTGNPLTKISICTGTATAIMLLNIMYIMLLHTDQEPFVTGHKLFVKKNI